VVQRKGGGLGASGFHSKAGWLSTVHFSGCQPPSSFRNSDTPLAGIKREQRHAAIGQAIERCALSLSHRPSRQVGRTNPSAGLPSFGLINKRAHLPCALLLQRRDVDCEWLRWVHGRQFQAWNDDVQTDRESGQMDRNREAALENRLSVSQDAGQ
jgi:hypothetical protein